MDGIIYSIIKTKSPYNVELRENKVDGTIVKKIIKESEGNYVLECKKAGTYVISITDGDGKKINSRIFNYIPKKKEPTKPILEFTSVYPNSGTKKSPTIVKNGDFFEFDINVKSTSFNIIPYRVKIYSTKNNGVNNLIGDVIEGDNFIKDDLIMNNNLSSNIIHTVSGIFNIDNKVKSGIIQFILEVDSNNNGKFKKQQILYYKLLK